MNALGARVRLVKGAYREPRTVAYQAKATSTRRSSRSCRLLLTEGTYPAIATHDPAMIDATARVRRQRGDRAGSLRVPDALRHPPRPAGAADARRATGSASTFRSAANGSPTSCAGWANAPPMSASSSAACFASADGGCVAVRPRYVSAGRRAIALVQPLPLPLADARTRIVTLTLIVLTDLRIRLTSWHTS